jgi:hypothetical protein
VAQLTGESTKYREFCEKRYKKTEQSAITLARRTVHTIWYVLIQVLF